MLHAAVDDFKEAKSEDEQAVKTFEASDEYTQWMAAGSANTIEFFALIDHWCGKKYKENVAIESKHS